MNSETYIKTLGENIEKLNHDEINNIKYPLMQAIYSEQNQASKRPVNLEKRSTVKKFGFAAAGAIMIASLVGGIGAFDASTGKNTAYASPLARLRSVAAEQEITGITYFKTHSDVQYVDEQGALINNKFDIETWESSTGTVSRYEGKDMLLKTADMDVWFSSSEGQQVENWISPADLPTDVEALKNALYSQADQDTKDAVSRDQIIYSRASIYLNGASTPGNKGTISPELRSALIGAIGTLSDVKVDENALDNDGRKTIAFTRRFTNNGQDIEVTDYFDPSTSRNLGEKTLDRSSLPGQTLTSTTTVRDIKTVDSMPN